MAKTRLNTKMREEILESILKATTFYTKREELLQEQARLVRNELIDRLPEGFLEKTKHLPAEWLAHCTEVYISDSYLQELREEGKDNWDFGRRCTFEPFRTPICFDNSIDGENSMFDGIRKRAKQLMAKHEKAHLETQGFLASCRYIEDITETMPRLAKHVIREGTYYPLAVTTKTLTSALEDLGFDATEK